MPVLLQNETFIRDDNVNTDKTSNEDNLDTSNRNGV